jgi:hypothetical protein
MGACEFGDEYPSFGDSVAVLAGQLKMEPQQ